MNRRLFCAFVVATLFLTTTRPAFAARIYNLLPVKVSVFGGIIDGVSHLQPGERSPSLSWPHSSIITVMIGKANPENRVCLLQFGPHAEITGGHYLIIGHRGKEIVCTVCDSDYRQMQQTRDEAPAAYWPELANRSSKTGC